MGRRTVFQLGVLLACVALAAFVYLEGGSWQGPTGRTGAAQKVTIGTLDWTGYLGLYLAQVEGHFANHGLDVDIRSYDSYSELAQDYRNGVLDGRAAIAMDSVREAMNGIDHKVVFVIDHSNGADAIVGSDKIRSPQDLKGRRIGFERGSVEQYLLEVVLQNAGLTLEDVVPVEVRYEEAPAVLSDGAVDAVVTHQPYVSEIAEKPGFRIIATSRDTPGLITDVMTFRTEYLEANPEAVLRFTRAYFDALTSWQSRPKAAYDQVSRVLGVSSRSIEEQMDGIVIVDEIANRSEMSFASGKRSLYANLDGVAAFLRARDGAPLFDVDEMIDAYFVHAAR